MEIIRKHIYGTRRLVPSVKIHKRVLAKRKEITITRDYLIKSIRHKRIKIVLTHNHKPIEVEVDAKQFINMFNEKNGNSITAVYKDGNRLRGSKVDEIIDTIQTLPRNKFIFDSGLNYKNLLHGMVQVKTRFFFVIHSADYNLKDSIIVSNQYK